MMMMDYSSQYAASSFGSDTLSGSMGSGRLPRVRTVRMVRPNHGTLPLPGLTCRHGPSLGFSVRGGREHGTGFFVSHVEPASEAHRQGLKVGDQIVRVNGFTVEDAIHKEVLQLISNHTHLTLKVRSVGMIPVKDKKTDPLSWQIITDYNSSTRSSPQLSEKIQDVRINIMVAPRTKLGCGICKGPEWKPGIFVQFTKEGGIAREAGLRPGDQILYCNNVDFSDIPFNEAVNLMKGARQLDLIVRKGAGSELFPGESSGYNSSASSVTGDQSPSWSESKRLSIVKEESLDLEDRLSQLDRFKTKKWEKIEWDDDRDEKPASYQFKPTIINLSDTNTSMIKVNSSEECQKEEPTKANGCNTLGRNKSNKIADICLVSHQHETKTVVVEVHRSDEKEKTVLAKSPSINSFNSVTSRNSITSSTLSSAICEEIQRRAARNKKTPATETTSPPPSIDEQLQMKKILKGVDSEKQQQHNQLMNEFRKAHRKMFKGAEDREEDEVANTPEKGSNNETQGRNSPRTEPVVQQTINERLSSLSNNQRETSQEKSSTPISRKGSNASVLSPPPPPPLPIGEIDEVGSPKSPTQPKQKVKAPPPPVPQKVTPSNQPPPCPTPDYDTLSISSTSTLPKKLSVNGFLKKELNKSLSHNGFGTSPEAESLEKSPKLNQQNGITPKNQNSYFKPKNSSASPNPPNGIVANGTLTKQRPVSVIIGEYPSGTSRKQPKKLDFLNGSRENAIRGPNSDSISSQFASELAQTLNRSNLRKKTESMHSTDVFTMYKTITDNPISVNYPKFAETSVKLWEYYNLAQPELKPRSKHRRRYAFLPQPYFLNGLGPWNLTPGARYSVQMKRAVSLVNIRRQPAEPELRLPVSKRQLVASVSYEDVRLDDKMFPNNNILKSANKSPVIFFWTPEYWYRPRSARDAYLELQTHLSKIRRYHQVNDTRRSPRTARKLFRRKKKKERESILSDSDNSFDTSTTTTRSKRKKQTNFFLNRVQDLVKDNKAPEETSLQFLKRILRLEISLTAWDFDSSTLAYQLTLIDRDLFLKIPPNELGVLIWQQSSKNAPNIGALIAFSHRISCLVATEILRDDSEKIRARLVARFINTAEKCNKISNYQSCRSVLCGLQSPPIYRLYSTWMYLRKKHATKYQVFEKLCRLYRDPRLPAYQKAFHRSCQTNQYLPYIGDIIAKLLGRIPEYGDNVLINSVSKSGKLIQSQVCLKKRIEDHESMPGLLKKFVATLKSWTMDQRSDTGDRGDDITQSQTTKRSRGLADYYKPLSCYEDNRYERLKEAVELLEKFQRAATNYVFTRNELAAEYLLKARYREDRENFYNSFNVEPPIT